MIINICIYNLGFVLVAKSGVMFYTISNDSSNKRSFWGPGGFVRGLDLRSGPKSVHGNWPPGAYRGLPLPLPTTTSTCIYIYICIKKKV